ncbi:MAG: hypothetical protein JKY03_09060 [Aureispira sp.]|nr:hypothetical protein [Aureispira sp.]
MMTNWKHSAQYFFKMLFGALFIGSLSGCGPTNSSPATPDNYAFSKINCYVRYLAQNRQLQADMTFRTDSTKAIEGQVFLNDLPMIFRNRPKVGLQYNLTKNSTAFEQKYTFSYTEKDGSTAKLEIELNPFDSLKVASDGISKSGGGLLVWQGPALGSEDGLVLIFSDEKGNTFSINHNGISKGNKFQILAEYANRLEVGPATILATRKKTIIKRENEVTKMLTFEYYSAPIKFEVKE